MRALSIFAPMSLECERHNQVKYILPILLIYAASCDTTQAQDYKEIPAKSMYWSDGDRGRIDGMKFRLAANIDAPEIGGVGARGGAKCGEERALGYEAKAFMIELTNSV